MFMINRFIRHPDSQQKVRFIKTRPNQIFVKRILVKLPNDNRAVCTFWRPGKVVKAAQEGSIQYIDFKKKHDWWGRIGPPRARKDDTTSFNVVCYFTQCRKG